MNKQRIGKKHLVNALTSLILLGLFSQVAFAVTSATDTQCDSRLDVTIAASARSSLSSSANCQTRGLTTAVGFSLTSPTPADATVTDSSALVSAGGELYESFVSGVRQAVVLLTPNRSLMMSRNLATTTGVDWDMGLTVQPVTGANNSWLTGTYSFLRLNRETRVVDAAHQTNAALSQIFDPVSMSVTFNGDSTCSVSGYSSWFGYELTTDPALFYSQPDGANYGLHQAVYAGAGSGQQHKDSNLTFTSCAYTLGTDGKLIVTYVGTKGDASAFNVSNAYFVSADTRYIVSTVDATKNLYRGFEVGVRVGAIAGADQTTWNNNIAGTFLFNAPSVEWQGATGPLSGPNNEHRNNNKATQCINKGSMVLKAVASGFAGWNGCTVDLAKSCTVRSEEGYGETSGGANNGSVSILHTSSASVTSTTCRYQVDGNGALSAIVSIATAEGSQNVTFSGTIANGGQAIVLRGKYEGTNMTNPSSTFAPARTIKNDLYLAALIGLQYTGTLTADADVDGMSNEKEFLGNGQFIADFDSDGMPDTWEITYGLNPFDSSDAATDLDGDGVSNLQEYLNGTNPTVPNVTAHAKNDFDADHDSDVMWYDSSTGNINLWSMQSGLRTNWTFVAYWADTTNTPSLSGDIDHDGDSDILWYNPNSGNVNAWVMQAGAKVNWLFVGYWPDANVKPVAMGDFDGDGDDDILWYNSVTGDVNIWVMQAGIRSNWLYVGYWPDTNYSPVLVGDFDGDGDDDILWWSSVSGNVNIWVMQAGVRVNWLYVGFWSNTANKPVGVGDIDHDGDDDIIWWNSSTGDVNAWIMQANARANWLYVGGWSDTNNHIEEVGDFNGDGTADILWRNITNGSVTSWPMLNGIKQTGQYIGTFPGATNSIKAGL